MQIPVYLSSVINKHGHKLCSCKPKGEAERYQGHHVKEQQLKPNQCKESQWCLKMLLFSDSFFFSSLACTTYFIAVTLNYKVFGASTH